VRTLVSARRCPAGTALCSKYCHSVSCFKRAAEGLSLLPDSALRMAQAACAAEELGGAWAASEPPAAYAADAEGRLQEDADGDAGWCARWCLADASHVRQLCVRHTGRRQECLNACGLPGELACV